MKKYDELHKFIKNYIKERFLFEGYCDALKVLLSLLEDAMSNLTYELLDYESSKFLEDTLHKAILDAYVVALELNHKLSKDNKWRIYGHIILK